MRYIFKNYHTFFRNHTPLFVLCMSVVIVSVLLIHFVYGVYQNYSIVQDGDYDQVEGCDEFYFQFSDGLVTKADLDRCIARISGQMDLIEASGNSDYVILSVSAPLDWNYHNAEVSDNTIVKVAIDRTGVAAPDIVFDNMKASGILDASRWTDVQEKEGAQVALFWDYNKPDWQADGIHPEEALNADNTVTIEGKKYNIIGYQTFQYQPLIPYSSLDKDIVFTAGVLTFPEHMSMTSYEILTNILKEELGDRVTLEYPGTMQKDNVHYVYNIVFIVVILVAGVASVDLMFLYRFYLRKNRYKMTVFRLCGMSRWKNIAIQIGEFLMLTLPGYLAAVVVFATILLPELQPLYIYMPKSFSLPVYCALLGIYLICSLIFCLAVTQHECHRSVIGIAD